MSTRGRSRRDADSKEPATPRTRNKRSKAEAATPNGSRRRTRGSRGESTTTPRKTKQRKVDTAVKSEPPPDEKELAPDQAPPAQDVDPTKAPHAAQKRHHSQMTPSSGPPSAPPANGAESKVELHTHKKRKLGEGEDGQGPQSPRRESARARQPPDYALLAGRRSDSESKVAATTPSTPANQPNNTNTNNANNAPTSSPAATVKVEPATDQKTSAQPPQQATTPTVTAIPATTPTVTAIPATIAPSATSGLSALAQLQAAQSKSLAELESRRDFLVARIKEFKLTQGRRLPIGSEAPRTKAHWDYLLGEMEWMATDFVRERKWKAALAKRVSKAVKQYHEKQKTSAHRRLKKEVDGRKRRAAEVSKMIKTFWANIGALVRYNFKQELELKRKEAYDRQLQRLVGQTKHLSAALAEDLSSRAHAASKAAGAELSSEGEEEADSNDKDFEVDEEEEDDDDEETLEEQEQEEGKEGVSAADELKDLEAEAQLPLADLIKDYAAAMEEEPDDEEGADGDDAADEQDSDAMEQDTEAAATKPEAAANATEQKAEQSAPMDVDSGETKTAPTTIEPAAANAVKSEESTDTSAMIANPKVRTAFDQASAAMPSGFTYQSVKVKTTVPHLLRGTLREYQHIGLDWLVSMYDNKLNGILADEMGLGKTIQTIALFAFLACERQVWGQHLVVVPTSTLINWEMEFKKWCPGFKILCYYGTQKERKLKRKGWSDPNAFHVCITSYQLVLQDHHVFRRKKWHYLVLDEAHNIKNYQSQRWQVLISFNSAHRLLLTGTPLQNDMMELWALMHFLMPNVFESQSEFKEWFRNPLTKMLDGSTAMNADLVKRLHGVLRPFLLRRLKTEVEKQLPAKKEHIVQCRLSKRQRRLYEDFMAASDTRRTLEGGSFLGLMNVLMQLRKVCNHPDIFAGRAIVSPFDQTEPIEYHVPSLITNIVNTDTLSSVNMDFLNLIVTSHCQSRFSWQRQPLEVKLPSDPVDDSVIDLSTLDTESNAESAFEAFWAKYTDSLCTAHDAVSTHMNNYVNPFRSACHNVYGWDTLKCVSLLHPIFDMHVINESNPVPQHPKALLDAVLRPEERAQQMSQQLNLFIRNTPAARAPPVEMVYSHHDFSKDARDAHAQTQLVRTMSPKCSIFRVPWVNTQLNFPDKKLIQFDCGKLQELSRLLSKLNAEGHRVLIFTQMTRMLDILEAFLNLYDYKYLRLDGSTKIDQRQRLMERYNHDTRIFAFILSTRSGGLGINLTGADTVIFYDTDWNPAMDAQAQDRCHRIGQTREVHIYRLVTTRTVEENILRKSMQKRNMTNIVIGDGQFTTEFFNRFDPREILGLEAKSKSAESKPSVAQGAAVVEEEERPTDASLRMAMASVEDESDRLAAKIAMDEQEADFAVFRDPPVTGAAKKPAAKTTALTPSKQTAAPSTAPAAPAPVAAVAPVAPQPVSSIAASLSKVERYALRFAEVTDPVVTQTERRNAEDSLRFQEEKWKEEHIRKLQKQQEARSFVRDGGTVSNVVRQPSSSRYSFRKRSATKMSNSEFDEESKNEFAEEEALFYPLRDSLNESLNAEITTLQERNYIRDHENIKPPSYPAEHQLRTYYPDYRYHWTHSHVMQSSLRARATGSWWGLFATPDKLARMIRKKKQRASKIRLLARKKGEVIVCRIPRSRISGYRPRLNTASWRSTDPQRRRLVPPPSHRAREQGALANASPWSDRKDKRTKRPRISAEEAALRVDWTEEEDNIILGVLALYQSNFALVADVLNSHSTVQGRLRSPADCKKRYQALINGTTHVSQRDSSLSVKRDEERSRKKKKSRKGSREGTERRPLPSARLPFGFGSTRAWHLVQNSMKSVSAEKKACKDAMLTSIPPTKDDKMIAFKSHTSHQKAVADAHTRLMLPPSAIGKTLMPQNVFQLSRQRRRSAEKPQSMPGMPAYPSKPAHVATRSVDMRAFPSRGLPHLPGSQKPSSHRSTSAKDSASPSKSKKSSRKQKDKSSKTPKRTHSTKKNKKSSSRTSSSMTSGARPGQSYPPPTSSSTPPIYSTPRVPGHPSGTRPVPHGSSVSGARPYTPSGYSYGFTSKSHNEYVGHVLRHVPALKPQVAVILRRSDISEDAKLGHIKALYVQHAQTGPAQSSVSSTYMPAANTKVDKR